MGKLDLLFNKSWFIKISSLVIAVMLFMMVNMDNTTRTQPGGIPGITDGSRVLEEVELNVYFDEENYVLTEAPETVQVTLSGPQNVLTMAQATQLQQELYVDLEGKEAGTHYERVHHSGFPADVTVSIVPMTVRVTLQERQTVSLPVEIVLENEGAMVEGYVAGNPQASPSSVEVTAAQGIIEQIATARAAVDLSGRDESFEQSVQVLFYDENGNEMELNANPPAVDVTVPVTSPNKEVPVRVGRTGSPPDGVAVESVTVSPEVVTVYGPVDVINNITFIDLADIDLSNIEGDTSIEAEVPVPDGAEGVSPETVTVFIDAEEEAERTFSDFNIQIEGLDDDYSLEFISPEEGQFDLTANGSADALERLGREDINVVLDAEGLEPGEHESEIEVSGPSNIRFSQQEMTVSFIISENSNTISQAEPNEADANGEENNGDNNGNNNNVNNNENNF